METNIPEGITVFSVPENQRKKLRSTNMVERLNREIKRRTRVATLFPDEASLLRLYSKKIILPGTCKSAVGREIDDTIFLCAF